MSRECGDVCLEYLSESAVEGGGGAGRGAVGGAQAARDATPSPGLSQVGREAAPCRGEGPRPHSRRETEVGKSGPRVETVLM